MKKNLGLIGGDLLIISFVITAIYRWNDNDFGLKQLWISLAIIQFLMQVYKHWKYYNNCKKIF